MSNVYQFHTLPNFLLSCVIFSKMARPDSALRVIKSTVFASLCNLLNLLIYVLNVAIPIRKQGDYGVFRIRKVAIAFICVAEKLIFAIESAVIAHENLSEILLVVSFPLKCLHALPTPQWTRTEELRLPLEAGVNKVVGDRRASYRFPFRKREACLCGVAYTRLLGPRMTGNPVITAIETPCSDAATTSEWNTAAARPVTFSNWQ